MPALKIMAKGQVLKKLREGFVAKGHNQAQEGALLPHEPIKVRSHIKQSSLINMNIE